jgi:hypothetical protein
MMYVGIINEINEPRALMATSKPIPTYCPNIVCRTGKVNEEKNIMSTKISSILVATEDVIPIAIRPRTSTIGYKCKGLTICK